MPWNAQERSIQEHAGIPKSTKEQRAGARREGFRFSGLGAEGFNFLARGRHRVRGFGGCMRSRVLEGSNFLFLPQGKTARKCSLLGWILASWGLLGWILVTWRLLCWIRASWRLLNLLEPPGLDSGLLVAPAASWAGFRPPAASWF